MGISTGHFHDQILIFIPTKGCCNVKKMLLHVMFGVGMITSNTSLSAVVTQECREAMQKIDSLNNSIVSAQVQYLFIDERVGRAYTDYLNAVGSCASDDWGCFWRAENTFYYAMEGLQAEIDQYWVDYNNLWTEMYAAQDEMNLACSE